VATPDKTNPKTAVRVQPGDTLSQIAKDAGVSLKTIYELNPKFKEDPKYQGGNMIWSNTLVNLAPKEKVATPVKVETPKVETPKVETPKVETPKVETPVDNPVDNGNNGANTDQNGTQGGVSPEQVGGGGATGGMPGGATGFSGGFSQADIDKAFKDGQAAAAAAAKADADAAAKAAADAKYATQVKAIDKMVNAFKANGIDDPAFASFISGKILADASQEEILLELYNQPAYKARFPGMAELRSKNRAITEAEYIKIENQYSQTLRFFDLPAGFKDDRATFGKLIGGEVSAKELQDRAQIAQDMSKTTNPEIRDALKNFYNVGEGAITAYFLDSNAALPILQKQAKAAAIAGIGKVSGFSQFGKDEAIATASNAAYANLSESDLVKNFGVAANLRDTQQRLSYLENNNYSDREALQAVIESDQQAILASQRRAAREVARFGGSSGLGSASLKTGSEGRI